MNITTSQRTAIDTFVKQLEGYYTLEQYTAAGQFWAKDSTVWKCIQQNGTGQIRLICWHNYTHKPGSIEWRPAIIIRAVLAHLNLPYSTTLFVETPGAVSHKMKSLTEAELDNKQIQEELIIPNSSNRFFYGKIATVLN